MTRRRAQHDWLRRLSGCRLAGLLCCLLILSAPGAALHPCGWLVTVVRPHNLETSCPQQEEDEEGSSSKVASSSAGHPKRLTRSRARHRVCMASAALKRLESPFAARPACPSHSPAGSCAYANGVGVPLRC
jgi:hypothetical protein